MCDVVGEGVCQPCRCNCSVLQKMVASVSLEDTGVKVRECREKHAHDDAMYCPCQHILCGLHNPAWSERGGQVSHKDVIILSWRSVATDFQFAHIWRTTVQRR